MNTFRRLGLERVLSVLFGVGVLSGCTGFSEEKIVGTISMNPKSGYSSIDLDDADTHKKIQLFPGKYSLTFREGNVFGKVPRVEISDPSGKILGAVEIPAKSFRKDGSFEVYAKDSRYAFNILGGKREVPVGGVRRYGLLDQYCTYQEVYACTRSETQCDSDGKNCHSVDVPDICSRTVAGERDEVLQDETYKEVYRILFEAYDLVNIGQFQAESPIRARTVLLAADSCT